MSVWICRSPKTEPTDEEMLDVPASLAFLLFLEVLMAFEV
jgi:hypothetical protein